MALSWDVLGIFYGWTVREKLDKFSTPLRNLPHLSHPGRVKQAFRGPSRRQSYALGTGLNGRNALAFGLMAFIHFVVVGMHRFINEDMWNEVSQL
jgi:hypothetical protein